jgi:hypothetical protein
MNATIVTWVFGISALKRRHGLRRCRYRGLVGVERWVGLEVIANDLLVWDERALGHAEGNGELSDGTRR